MIDIRRAEHPSELHDVRSLMRAFVEWGRALSPMDREKVDLYFDAAAYRASTVPPPAAC